jgi:aromatic ring-cleaving dioxygenase
MFDWTMTATWQRGTKGPRWYQRRLVLKKALWFEVEPHTRVFNGHDVTFNDTAMGTCLDWLYFWRGWLEIEYGVVAGNPSVWVEVER